MTNSIKTIPEANISAHCSECGEQVDEYCEAHPAATVETTFRAAKVETIHTTTAIDGMSHDDHERVRIVLGTCALSSIGSCAQLLELIDYAVSSGRLPDDDRDAAYRACCEYLGVDA